MKNVELLQWDEPIQYNHFSRTTGLKTFVYQYSREILDKIIKNGQEVQTNKIKFNV